MVMGCKIGHWIVAGTDDNFDHAAAEAVMQCKKHARSTLKPRFGVILACAVYSDMRRARLAYQQPQAACSGLRSTPIVGIDG